ncbi:Snf7-domain-containing protein [Lipomyces tetrasporus]|uniref:Snf7-domain-containing protein n=1 Tax=Lipomyces tetrasporus TaxID=54092 RepID=A0AAD7QUU6_9ASCO|nr:Snf7-domain-containing protein [Lipomyces tetrasporus]KAJ8101900.1 Snf7-domain-containing protein [Lipomyces tetrasporus]
MGNYSSRPNRKITKHDRAILDMKLQRDTLQQYQRRIQVILDREREIARQCLERGDKERALLALRKRKYKVQLLSKTDSQLETLERLTQSIEFALVEKDVLFGLQQGSQVLKEINREMSMDKVERLLDESADGIAYQNEVSQMLADSITNAEEAEIEEELEAMRREELVKTIPTAPETELPQAQPEAAEEEAEPEEEAEEPARQASKARNRAEPLLA